LNTKGQGYKVAKKRTQIKKEDSGEKDGGCRLQTFQTEQRSEGLPDIIKDDWDGEEKARVKGQFEKG
jgi:hypothetical protein